MEPVELLRIIFIVGISLFYFILSANKKKKKEEKQRQVEREDIEGDIQDDNQQKNLIEDMMHTIIDENVRKKRARVSSKKSQTKQVSTPSNTPSYFSTSAPVEGEQEIVVEESDDNLENLIPNFDNKDELRKAIITSEILNKKY